MAGDPEEKPSTSQDCESTKAAVLDTFNQLRKWQVDQLEKFKKMQQLAERQKLIRLSDGSQKHFEKALEHDAKSPESEDTQQNYFPESSNVSLAAENSDNTLKESFMSGRLQRCFDDSSESSHSIYRNKVKNFEQNCSSSRPKRRFLKKGTGLLRYMPKSATNRSALNSIRSKAHTLSTSSPKKNAHLLQRTLQLKPAIHNTDAPAETVKYIRFDIPSDILDQVDENDEPTIFKSATCVVQNQDNCRANFPSSSISYEEDCGTKEKLGVVSNSDNEDLNLWKENRELEEFEIMEKYAQNSSFSSDSSVVQRFIVPEEKINVKNFEQNYSSSKPKRQFLKKGTGLLRYVPKSATNRSALNSIRSNAHTLSTSSPKLYRQKLVSDVPTTAVNAMHITEVLKALKACALVFLTFVAFAIVFYVECCCS